MKQIIQFILSILAMLSVLSVTFPSNLDPKVKSTEGTTRAVVVGISNYQADDIEPIPEASKNAEAFATYLMSNDGLGLTKEQIMLITDEEATKAKIHASLDWLLEMTNKNDQLYIFYSGYGEEERKQNTRPLFLLPYDTPSKVLVSNSVPFNNLINSLNEKAIKKGAQIDLFVELYGLSDIEINKEPEDPQETNNVKDFKEVMISYKPQNNNLHSRNSFTPVLLNGLIGGADDNRDKKISFDEIKTYLSSQKIDNTLQPSIYILTDNVDETIANVSSKFSTANEMMDTFSAIIQLETDDYERSLLAKENQNIQSLYQDFLIAIRIGNLLSPETRSAYYYYQKVIGESSSDPLKRSLKRNLAVALQNEAQQAINAYLRMDPIEMRNRIEFSNKYYQYAKYLEKANELLGESHFLYGSIKAKELYFQGLALRLELESSKAVASNFQKAVTIQYEALKFEPYASLVYHELGYLHTKLNQRSQAIVLYKKAHDLAPKWASPVNNIGATYLLSKDYTKADRWFKEAISINENYATPYYNLACSNAIRGKKKLALLWLEQALQKGFSFKKIILQDSDLASIRETEEFNNLMETYFPKKYGF